MAASLAERLKLKQYQVDTWTNREQLCLASAVMRSGDQNWVAVRRNIKMLTTETSRPQDWYSTKNCALQYAKLLERVDTPKRKRERGDAANQTPGEIVTKMLSKQRVEELRALESEEKAAYTALRQEIQQLEGGLLDHKLDELWDQLVKEQAEEEEEEQRHQQWLKEREEKITAIQQALKHQGPKVTMPPHKKKQKSHSGGPGTAATSRRSSGVSETSSEVDSTVDSPDLNEATPESISQDEGGGGGGGGGESEVRPTPPSPLLTTLLSKSPLSAASLPTTPSPLAQQQQQQRNVRGVGISPVSVALQNLVTSAISGTDTTNKEKPSHTSPVASGSSTLSRLLDLPPSTPGGPLPRLTDLPAPTTPTSTPAIFQPKDQEKKSEALKKCGRESESCGDSKGCGADDAAKDCSSIGEEKLPEISVAAGVKSDESRKVTQEETGVSLQEEAKEGAKEEEGEDFKKPESVDEEKPDVKEANVGQVTDTQQQHQQQQQQEPAATKEKSDDKTKVKEQSDEANVKKTSSKTVEVEEESQSGTDEHHGKTDVKTEDEDIYEVIASLETTGTEKDIKEGDAGIARKDTQSTGSEEKKSELDDDEETDSKKSKEDCDVSEDTTDHQAEDKAVTESSPPEGRDDADREKKPTEEDLPASAHVTEDSAASVDCEKKVKKTYRREPDDDQYKEDSKGWASEEESSSTSSRKRKISSGELPLGCPSPLISESAPNSPASTHCGDDSESEKAYRSWKKPIMILWNEIAAHKFASLFLRPITDEKAPGYHSVVYRAMDLQKIKRNIESGLIRTTAEFQRDIMLMFLNATMYNTRDHNVYHMAYQMMKDAVSTIEDFLNTQMLARAEDTPQKSLRRETRESSAKRIDDDPKRKREPLDEKSMKKRRI